MGLLLKIKLERRKDYVIRIAFLYCVHFYSMDLLKTKVEIKHKQKNITGVSDIISH